MKHDITAMLRQFSAESAVEEENVDQGQVGAEEILVVTDETTTELEEAIEQVAETVEGQEAVDESLNAAAGAVESLESAVASLVSARLNGERVTATAIRFWAQGIESSFEARGIPEEAYRELTQDFSESNESDNYSDYSTEAEEKAEGVFAKLWAMIKSAFARMRDFLARLVAWFSKSADAVESAGKKLLKAVEEKKGKKVDKDAKVQASAYGELMVGSSFDPENAVDKADGVFTVISGECNKLYDVGVSSAAALEGSGDKKSEIKKAGKATSDHLTAVAKAVTGLSAGGAKEWEMKVESNSERFWNEGKVVYTLKPKDGTKTVPGEVAVMSLDSLKKLAQNIIDLAGTVRKESDNAKRTQGKVNIRIGENAKGEQKNLADSRIVARTIASAISASSSIRGKVAGSVLTIGKKAYVYGMANVRRYK